MKTRSFLMLILAMGLLGTGQVLAAPAPAASDAAITGKVTTAFFNEPELRDSGVWVSTTQGVVQLAGVVEKARELQTAVELAERVPGVVKVDKEHVTVKQ